MRLQGSGARAVPWLPTDGGPGRGGALGGTLGGGGRMVEVPTHRRLGPGAAPPGAGTVRRGHEARHPLSVSACQPLLFYSTLRLARQPAGGMLVLLLGGLACRPQPAISLQWVHARLIPPASPASRQREQRERGAKMFGPAPPRPGVTPSARRGGKVGPGRGAGPPGARRLRPTSSLGAVAEIRCSHVAAISQAAAQSAS